MDAPLHYSADGAPIGEVSLDVYMGPCRVLHCLDSGALVQPHQLRRYAILRAADNQQRTDIGSSRGLLERAENGADRACIAEWDSSFTAIAPQTIELLASLGVRLIGIDTPSLDPQQTIRALPGTAYPPARSGLPYSRAG